MINLGVIGCGYWGPNLIRNFAKNDDCYIKWICDIDEAKLNKLQKNYAKINFTTDFADIIADKETDAVIIATPLDTHYEIVKNVLLAGKDVFIEKPFVENSRKSQDLIDIARKKKLILMVGYTYVYSPAVQKIKEKIQSGDLGSVYYINSVRVNFGIFRQKENVIWDLAVHDFSIISYWFNEMPLSVMCTGRDSLGRGQTDTAFLALNFKFGLMLYVLVSWLSPIKMRNMIIAGSKKMVFFNDERGLEKIKIYQQDTKLKNIKFSGEYQPTYNRSSIFSPWLDNRESLEIETSHFLKCIKSREKPNTDGVFGLKVVKILEAAGESLKTNKRIVISNT